MAITKTYTRDIATAGNYEKVQALTGASTGTAVVPYGFTTITVTTGEGTAAAVLTYKLDPPGVPGARKLIAVDLNSTKAATVAPKSTTYTFFGSTRQNLVFADSSTSAYPAFVELIGTSATKWAIMNLSSTGVTLT
jgi:hypothetical protein